MLKRWDSKITYFLHCGVFNFTAFTEYMIWPPRWKPGSFWHGVGILQRFMSFNPQILKFFRDTFILKTTITEVVVPGDDDLLTIVGKSFHLFHL
jgi:hypothetical protein